MCVDVCSSETSDVSIQNKKFLFQVGDSIQLKDNSHYQIALPLKFSSVKPPSNREFAYRRLMSLKRKFLKNPSFYNDYVQFVSKMLANDYAERASNCKESDVWYIPRHGVYHRLTLELPRVGLT